MDTFFWTPTVHVRTCMSVVFETYVHVRTNIKKYLQLQVHSNTIHPMEYSIYMCVCSFKFFFMHKYVRTYVHIYIRTCTAQPDESGANSNIKGKVH